MTINGSIRVANTAATPYFSPVAGAYLGAQTVTIIADAGSTIYYTTDGSYPDGSSPHGPTPITGIVIPVDSTMTIQAYASRPGYSDSPVATANYITMSKAIWTDTGGGSWPETSHWLNGVVGTGGGVTADFSTLTLDQDTTVTLDGARAQTIAIAGQDAAAPKPFLESEGFIAQLIVAKTGHFRLKGVYPLHQRP